jgi:hypothetical protein
MSTTENESQTQEPAAPAKPSYRLGPHSPEKFLTLSLGLGSLVKEAISTELLAGSFKDRKNVQGNSGDPFRGTHPRNRQG